MHAHRLYLIGLAVSTLLAASETPSQSKQGPPNPRFELSATDRAAISTTFTYQGKLEENGQAIDGSRRMEFALSTVDDCSSLETQVISRSVDFTDGLFAVDLGFSSDVFNGQALWLDIAVEDSDVACQPVRAAPYASSLRPQARVEADIGAEEQLLDIRSGTGPYDDEGALGAKIGRRTSLGYPVGIYGYAYEFGSVGVWGRSDSEFGWGVTGVAEANDSIGVRGIANASSSQTHGVYGEANSPDGSAGYFETTTSTDPGWGLIAEGRNGAKITGRSGSGLRARASGADTGYGDDAVDGVHGDGDGVVGESEGTGDLDNGVIGFSAGGYGVYGFSNGTGQYGGYFDDPIFVNGGCTGCTTRYVARNVSDARLRPGDPVRAAGVDTQTTRSGQPVILTAPAARGDNVLGVVVGGTTMVRSDGGEDDVQAGAHWGPIRGVAAPDDFVVIATEGLARVRVDPAAAMTVGERLQIGEDGATRAGAGPTFAMVLGEPSSRERQDLVWALLGDR